MSTTMNGSTSAPLSSANASKGNPGGTNPAGSKTQFKTNTAGKSLDGARKQASSPVDGSSSRKAPPPKAWTSGTNPITQRSTASPVANGVANGHMKAGASQKSSKTETNTSDRHAHDRLLFLLANFTGQDAVVTLRTGEAFSGVFSGATTESNDSRFILKMVKRFKGSSTQQSNGASDLSDEYIGDGDEHMLAFNIQDTVDLSVSNLNLQSSTIKATNGASSTFRTDVEISGNLNMKERELQRWEPGPDTEVDLSLGADESTGTGSWDQFAANEKLYNVRSDYDEDLYTTSIDRSNPRYKQLEREAARLAREMERDGEGKRNNADADAGLDEEDKYSGVRRETPALGKSGPNAYVPPSKRAAASKPVVTGAPFDPAIISSQLARPSQEAAPTKKEEAKPTANETASTGAAAEPVKAVTQDKAAAPADPKSLAVPMEGTKSNSPQVQSQNDGAGANYYQEVYESFKQFTNAEKLRLQAHQRAVAAQKTTTARQEKSVKLNDLKKFSQNFRLHSRVPEDLVPILAKTKEKQDEIREKAEQQAREKELKAKDVTSESSTPSMQDTSIPDIRSQRATPSAPAGDVADAGSTSGPKGGQFSKAKPQNSPAQLPRGPGVFSQRVEQNRAQYRPGTNNNNVSTPMPIQPTKTPPTGPAADSRVMSPTSAAMRFNVKAMEFRPNPSASTFTPNASDLPGSKRPSVADASVAPSSGTFFANSKKAEPIANRPSLADAFNPIKRMLKSAEEEKNPLFAANGGIPQAFRTAPTWEVPEANSEKSYQDMFPKALSNAPSSPMHAQQNGIMAHQHQLPLHLQNGPGLHAHNQQTPRFYAAQPHHAPQHMEDQRMQYSSSNSSVQPSPRMGHPSMAYNGQMHAQMPFPYGMQGGGMSPAMQMRPVPAGQYMNGPGAPMGGHMMAQQPSNGPYMNGPNPQQMPMYPSPGSSHVQPHFAGHQMQHAPGGYNGSPRGHPMSHQGSAQGHTPQPVYMMPGANGPMMMQQQPGQMTPMRGYAQPQFQGQHPQHAYAMQQRAMSNNGYNPQMTPRQQHAMPQQGPGPVPVQPMRSSAGDDGK